VGRLAFELIVSHEKHGNEYGNFFSPTGSVERTARRIHSLAAFGQ
jgi:hypothetical protein